MGQQDKNRQQMENEKKKEYLRQYEKAVRQLKRIELEIREMRLDRFCPSMVVDAMPHARCINDLSAYAALLDKEERRYIKARYKRIQMCKEIKDRIERLENEDEKDVLLYRYINLMKWEDICKKMKYSWKQVHRIHSNALGNFIIEK